MKLVGQLADEAEADGQARDTRHGDPAVPEVRAVARLERVVRQALQDGAGLRTGDVVVSVNGDRVDSARGLIRAVAAAAPGSSVRLVVRTIV